MIDASIQLILMLRCNLYRFIWVLSKQLFIIEKKSSLVVSTSFGFA